MAPRVKKEEEISREDTLTLMMSNIRMKAGHMNVSGDATLSAITGRMAIAMSEIELHVNPVSLFLASLSREQLSSMLEKSDSTNGDSKTAWLKSLVFKHDLSALADKERNIKDLRDLMFDFINLAIAKEFLNENDGKVNWRDFKKSVDTTRSRIDQRLGAQAALADVEL